MKIITVIAMLLTLTTLSAQAETVERCFKASRGKVGRIIMTDKSVLVDYDVNDHARNTKESANFLRNVKRTSEEVSADAFLMGTGDGSDTRITLQNDYVILQALWSDGKPAGKPVKFAVVTCR